MLGFVPVDGVFEFNGKLYQVKKALTAHPCSFCAFRNDAVSCKQASVIFGNCSRNLRVDHQDVYIQQHENK